MLYSNLCIYSYNLIPMLLKLPIYEMVYGGSNFKALSLSKCFIDMGKTSCLKGDAVTKSIYIPNIM